MNLQEVAVITDYAGDFGFNPEQLAEVLLEIKEMQYLILNNKIKETKADHPFAFRGQAVGFNNLSKNGSIIYDQVRGNYVLTKRGAQIAEAAFGYPSSEELIPNIWEDYIRESKNDNGEVVQALIRFTHPVSRAPIKWGTVCRNCKIFVEQNLYFRSEYIACDSQSAFSSVYRFTNLKIEDFLEKYPNSKMPGCSKFAKKEN